MNRFTLYSSLFEAYVEAFPTKSKKLCQQEVNEEWNAVNSFTGNRAILRHN